jgi:hypothetical protein
MNVKIRYKCPYCGRSIEHNPAYAGSLVVCSACKGEFYEPTDPLPGRAAEKAQTRKSASAKPPIPRNPVGYDPNAGGDEGETPTVKAPETKAPAAAAPGAATASAPSGPRLKEPKSSQSKESASPLGGSLWEQVSEEPKAKPASKPASSAPAKMALPASSKAQPTSGPSKPSPTNTKPATPAASSSSDNADDEEIDFQAIINAELSKPKSAAPAASAPKSPVPTKPTAPSPSTPVSGPAKPAAPMARPATSPAAGAPLARPTASPAGPSSGSSTTSPSTAGHGNSLQTATPTDMANELRRRGLFGAIVFGDPSKPDQTQLALSDNMTRDDAKTFIMKLFAISKHAGGEEPKSGGMFGRFFGGGKES